MNLYNSFLLQGTKLEENQIRDPKAGGIQIPGFFRGKRTCLSVTKEDLSKHTLMLGATGTGKTNALYHYISQIKKQITEKDVMIIFDTKGDFIQKFYETQDCVIGNSRSFSQRSRRWNIYKEIAADGWEKEALECNTREIARAVFKKTIEKSSSQPFFANAACDLFSAILLAHMRVLKGDKAGMNLYLNNQALKQYLDNLSVYKIVELLEGEDDLKAVLTYLGSNDSEQGLGVLSELQSVVRQIFTGVFAKCGDFSIRSFVRNKGGRTLFVEYDLALGNILTPMYRLLFDLALKEAMGRKRADGDVYIICDEFKLLPDLEHIEDAVNFGRGLGIKVLAGLQSISQLYEIYGERKGRNIASGFSSIFSFRQNDPETRKYISGLYGENLILEQYKGIEQLLKEEKRKGNTIEDWEMASLGMGEAIVGLPFEVPFRFQFDLYKG